jgi:hypothetical protein
MTGAMGNVTACLKALQKGENGSPTTTILGNSNKLVGIERAGVSKPPRLFL